MSHAPAALTADQYLASRTLHGVKFGLDAMRALVAELKHPERAAPAVLIAGTNGKGSVAAYVDAALRASRLKVGRYTSPHLMHVNERFVVDGQEIDDEALEQAVGRVREAAERLVERRVLRDHPTFFEVTTAVAFDHFRREGVDVSVLEVGMGGRLDCTNVCEPLVSAVVSVDLEHEAFLGDTLAAIAGEKAGVLRPGRPTVLGPVGLDARLVVEAEAARLGAKLIHSHADVTLEDAEMGLCVRTPVRIFENLGVLPGARQRDNLVVALRLLEAAREAGLAVDLDAAARATAEVRWPGRMQWVAGRPPLLLDGAHNPAAAQALASELRRHGGPFVLLFGAMEDKNVEAMASSLFPLADEVVLTRAAALPRAAPADSLARRAGGFARRLHVVEGMDTAFEHARGLAANGKTLVVAGSLYLVGAVLERLRG